MFDVLAHAAPATAAAAAALSTGACWTMRSSTQSAVTGGGACTSGVSAAMSTLRACSRSASTASASSARPSGESSLGSAPPSRRCWAAWTSSWASRPRAAAELPGSEPSGRYTVAPRVNARALRCRASAPASVSRRTGTSATSTPWLARSAWASSAGGAGDHRALGRADDLRLGRRRVDRDGSRPGRPAGWRSRSAVSSRWRSGGPRAPGGSARGRGRSGAARAVGVGRRRRRRGRRRPRGAGPASTAQGRGCGERGRLLRDRRRGRRGGTRARAAGGCRGGRVGSRCRGGFGRARRRRMRSAAARRLAMTSPSWPRGAPRPSRRLSARVLRR